MKLAENAKHSLKTFEDAISGIADGTYCDEFTDLTLKAICNNIHMEAEIAMALDPDNGRRYVKLYFIRLSNCMDRMKEMRETADEVQLGRLDAVYDRLYNLFFFIGDLLIDDEE